ncbi:hypothetical protein GGQ84_002486 [Desulfitispora alkaliphila]|uniref:DUF6612 family protein n=1 Tax=Desulfitispora alkaliphila TaxID=622674 RepID=UPI003D243981
MNNAKKVANMLLIGLLVVSLLVPAAVADEQVGFVFNGKEFQADVILENGVSYASTAQLKAIPGLTFEQEGDVPLRAYFEGIGGTVAWDGANNQVTVSWREMKDDWTADELVMESTRVLQEANTYRMEGNANMKMVITDPGTDEIPEIPEMTTYIEGFIKQDPLTMYMKETMEFPQDMGMTEEELALIGMGGMTTEMVWKDNAIYQKMPGFDQWVVQDLNDLAMMDNLTNLMQASPQQSLEMMSQFGIINVFGESAVIDGQEYYTIKNYIDSETFKKVLEEFLSEVNFMEVFAGIQEQPEIDEAEIMEMQQMFEQLIQGIEINYYIDTMINKETLLTEYMVFDMNFKIGLDETINPEGPVNMEMSLAGDYKLFDFGTEIQTPDVSDAITQQEFFEQMMNMIEVPGELEN